MKIFLLIKDMVLMDNFTKRCGLLNGLVLVGSNNDASLGYSQIQTCVPDCIVVDYPSNFTAEQLKQAMSSVNPNVDIIALSSEEYFGTLKGQGIIAYSRNDIDKVFSYLENKMYQGTNPFGGNVGGNPFQTQNTNPFDGGSPTPPQNVNPFEGQATINTVTSIPNTVMMGNNNNNNSINNINNNSSSFTSSERIPLKQKIVAIHCPKGGVGKTTVSTNLSVLLSTVKLQREPLNVLLVDLDWAFGDTCINLGLQASPSVMNWVNDIKANPNKKDYTSADINKYLIDYKSTGLKILAAPPNHSDSVEITDSISKIIIDNIKNNTNFDVIILDCGNNTEAYTLMGLTAANLVYEVTSVDASAIADLKTVLDSLKMLHFPMDKIKLIVNKVPKEMDITLNEIAEVLNLQIIGRIPEHGEVRIQNNNGVPMVLKGQNSFTVGVTDIASKIIGTDLSKRKITTSKKSFFSFLKR